MACLCNTCTSDKILFVAISLFETFLVVCLNVAVPGSVTNIDQPAPTNKGEKKGNVLWSLSGIQLDSGEMILISIKWATNTNEGGT